MQSAAGPGRQGSGAERQAAHQLLDRTGQGVLSSALAPLKGRIESLLAQQAGGKRWPVERVRVIPHRTRTMDEQVFRIVCSSVLERKQLSFEYRARSTDEKTRRAVSPQRVHDGKQALGLVHALFSAPHSRCPIRPAAKSERGM